MHLLHRIEAFFFAPRSASAWGLMRMAWAASVFLTMLCELPDVIRFYSEPGLLPDSFLPLVTRSMYRFTILEFITTPLAVFLLYQLLLLSCVCMFLGLWPRAATILSVLLYFSFHERNPIPLGGGETVLRTVGFLLAISPGIRALSLERAGDQFAYWRKKGSMLAPLAMRAWPKRLLLWQILIIYLTSVWDKLMGNMWEWGTAVIVALHHPHFARLPAPLVDSLMPVIVLLCYATLFYESLWVLMLVPNRLLQRIPLLTQARLRRTLIIGGIAFHAGISLTMNVGSFFFAMTTLLIGLIEDEDIQALRRLLNRRWKGRVSVFYDGHCGFCMRSTFSIYLFDVLHRLRLVDFHNPVLRKKFAPDLAEKELDRSMHIRFPSGRTLHGFRAFRALTWHLPPFWLAAPFLYLPGAARVGEKLYRWKADTRKKCAHGECQV